MLRIPLSFKGKNPEAFPGPNNPWPAPGATSAARNPRYQEAISPCQINLTRLKLSLLLMRWHQ